MRYLVVEPHPDDLAFFCGGTVAKLIAEGHRGETLVVTEGEQGTLDRSYDSDEQRAACEVLGKSSPIFDSAVEDVISIRAVAEEEGKQANLPLAEAFNVRGLGILENIKDLVGGLSV